ncbi:ABC transporter ATP-binding protein [Meridianimarinicoccus aquatilis]|uniref:ABC transporter ATP-binding protein n=1 Tax=Meridianimarinicoccus aquatilis TaxID=2552766 RepID=A0A4R6B2M4_9RHOB|nr:ABC transporter ATP-binding protein [Fluviibacterium aquatile]TDL90404.1 ABC transporter ATP-binding protein [Fluviibacterium aquatile]
MTAPLLDLRGVTALYGSSQALFGVDLTVEAGQVTALMGRNGMGKTTTIRTICRLLPNRAGEVFLDGHELSGLPPHRVARMGVGLVPEGRRCFAPLTVRENLTAAARPGAWGLDRVVGLFPRLGERMAQRAGTLSGGEQQMLAIGRALMTNPRLLILDEATEGLAPTVRAEIWQAIGTLKRESGLGILLVDKSLRELSAVADSAVILDKGRSVWAGRIEELSPDLAASWLGV